MLNRRHKCQEGAAPAKVANTNELVACVEHNLIELTSLCQQTDISLIYTAHITSQVAMVPYYAMPIAMPMRCDAQLHTRLK
mmetsp:Transcript_19478/g.31896  ORF Transcript_19478/g.31896 Transcript_19478/m.31896 type:complete len:81 (-) Transcript_19478:1098-1340(-)